MTPLASLLLAFAAGAAAQNAAPPVGRSAADFLAVMDLELGKAGDDELRSALSESVEHQLLRVAHATGRFKLIDRANRDRILAEQAVQQSDCMSDECRIQAGQLLGAGRIVTGSVRVLGSARKVSLRLLDVESGQIVNSTDDTCACDEVGLVKVVGGAAWALMGEPVPEGLGVAAATGPAGGGAVAGLRGPAGMRVAGATPEPAGGLGVRVAPVPAPVAASPPDDGAARRAELAASARRRADEARATEEAAVGAAEAAEASRREQARAEREAAHVSEPDPRADGVRPGRDRALRLALELEAALLPIAAKAGPANLESYRGLGGGARVLYDLSPGFALGGRGRYQRLTLGVPPPSTALTRVSDVTFGRASADLLAVYRVPVGSSFAPYVGVGVGYFRATPSSGTGAATVTGLEVPLLVGFEVRLGGATSAFFEGELQRYQDLESDGPASDFMGFSFGATAGISFALPLL